MKKYSEYKDSGVEWIGDIPKHWEVKRFKNIIESIKNGTSAQQVDYDTNYKVTRIESISNGIINYEKVGNIEGFKGIEQYRLNKGDILFSNINSLEIVGNIAIYEGDENLYSGMNLLRIIAKKDINKKWLYFLIKSKYFKKSIESVAKHAINQVSVSTTNLKSIDVCIPTKQEQDKIANYLEKKDKQIETLISKKEELIETLKVSRTKLISETVTKGLDKDVPMKDSGVKWIGEIPSHWEISKLKFNTNKDFMYGANESGEDMQENQPRYIRITDINEDGNLKNDTYITLDYKKAKPYILEDKDILFARSGATVGKTFLYSKSECDLACFAGYLIKFAANRNKCKPEYIYYYTQSKMYEEFININISQATIQNVSAEKYKNLYNPLPPLAEQDEIVKYLDNKTSKIKNLIIKVEEQIDVLKKAKQKLITEVVTGKIDVTNL